MILYSETNFVLELAFVRDEVDDAEALLVSAESGLMKLVVPAFSLSEPFETVTRRSRDRKSILDRVDAEINELGRSKPYADLKSLSRDFTSLVANSADEERERLTNAQLRIIKAATIVPLTSEVLGRAIDIGSALGLSPQDSLVLSSIESHLSTIKEEPAVFVTKDRKDFLSGEVESLLAKHGCKLLTSFSDARGFIESRR